VGKVSSVMHRAQCMVQSASARCEVRGARCARALVLAALAVALSVSLVPSASAQGRQNRPRANQEVPPGQGPGPGPLADAGVPPAEIQRLFDAYVVMQAQQELGLSDEQYPKFLSRMRALQEVRRRSEVERNRLLQELRRITSNANSGDDLIKPRLKALADLEVRASTEIRGALEAIDQVLEVRQQARFRIFEEQMERRKVDLLLRARNANRPRNQPQF